MPDESLDELRTGAHQAVELRAGFAGQSSGESIAQVSLSVAVEIPLAGETAPTSKDGQGKHLALGEGSFEWLRFVASPEVQRRIVVDEGWLPVSKSLLDDEEVVQALPVVETYREQSKYKALRYGAPWYSDVTTDLATEITGAMLGRKTPQEALDAAASEAEKTIDGYNDQIDRC